MSLLASPAEAVESRIRELGLTVNERGIEASLRLESAFTPEILRRLQSGLEVSFEFTVRLRRKREGFPDKTVAERYVVNSVQYSNLTKMYKVTRRVDGTVIDADVTDSAEVMRAWMTLLDHLSLFDERDLDSSGSYYLRVKARLLGRFRMLFLPNDLETGWAETEPVRIQHNEE